jgi:hypothetical protein
MASGVMVCGNPVVGHLVGAGNHRVVESVETTCIRYVPSVLSGGVEPRQEKRIVLRAAKAPAGNVSGSRELGSNEEMGLLQKGRPHVERPQSSTVFYDRRYLDGELRGKPHDCKPVVAGPSKNSSLKTRRCGNQTASRVGGIAPFWKRLQSRKIPRRGSLCVPERGLRPVENRSAPRRETNAGCAPDSFGGGLPTGGGSSRFGGGHAA